MRLFLKQQKVLFISILLIFPGLSAQAQDSDETENTDYVKFGGALRFNAAHQNYEFEPTATSTYATFDTWRLNVSASYSDIILDFEYRFYPTFNTHFIHHGYIGYNFSESFNMQLGVTQVPFGNLTYNSHSWWFLIPYYVGLEDDYDMGIKFTYDVSDKLNIMAAYFLQQEPAGPAYGNASFGGPAAGTYSYNVIPDMNGDLSSDGSASSIQERNQFNLRLDYEMLEGTHIGVSGQMQGIYNSTLEDTEYGHAFAAHLNSDFNNFNVKAQFTNYNYAAKDDNGATLDRVQMGAYGDPYYGDGVAAKANIITAGVAYSIGVDWGPISNVQPYIDYSLMTKDGSIDVDGQTFDFEDSHMLVPGFLITAGNIFTYVDFALGKNHPWLTSDFGKGLGVGHVYSNDTNEYYYDAAKAGQPVPISEQDWNLRFNINIGYYF